MTNRGTPLEQAQEALRRTVAALARNAGTISEQDWRDQLVRAEARVAALSGTRARAREEG